MALALALALAGTGSNDEGAWCVQEEMLLYSLQQSVTSAVGGAVSTEHMHVLPECDAGLGGRGFAARKLACFGGVGVHRA